MITIEGLTKKFDEVTAVENLELEIRAGEVFGFLGPNGAGKTTTLRMLCALINPTAGMAQVAGYRIGEDDQALRRNVGILTEAPGMYDRLSAERNLGFFAHLYGVDDVDARVERYLKLLGLWERRAEAVGTFSRGMRQKLAIARAMLHEPPVLFLDEPTTGLDPEASRLVREFIEELRGEGRTIVLNTHNLDEADRLCDRIGVLNTRLLALDTPAALRREAFGRKVVIHLAELLPEYEAKVSDFPFVKEVESIDGRLVLTLDDPETHNPTIIAELVNAGAPVQFVGEIRQSLEDVYLHLVSNDSNHSEEGGAV